MCRNDFLNTRFTSCLSAGELSVSRVISTQLILECIKYAGNYWDKAVPSQCLDGKLEGAWMSLGLVLFCRKDCCCFKCNSSAGFSQNPQNVLCTQVTNFCNGPNGIN